MPTREQVHSEILDDLKARSTWETRQATFYKMRHNGLRRRNKPWPNAADLHFPLADTIIGKLKPYYFEQLFATDTLATFVCKSSQSVGLTTTAARWFDYKLKQESNLESEILTVIDYMLQSGRSVVKCYWDTECKTVKFDAVDSLKIIVPRKTKDLETAERIVHVMALSETSYRSNKNYTRQDEDFIKSIKGRGDTDETDKGGKEQEKDLREGITCGASDEEIIIWEVWQKTDGKWFVDTWSPLNPKEAVRQRFECPYELPKGYSPFVDFPYEVKDKGWYSPRGIVEQVAPFESSLCKLWNEKHDCMTLYNRPLFRSSKEIPNAQNLQFHPGQVLPFDIQPVQHQQPPFSFDQEMISTRQVAEQRIAMPDYGMNQVMNTQDRRTATEIQAVGEVMGNATDLRMRLFRKSLGRLYRVAHALLIQYDKESLNYAFEDAIQTAQAEAIHSDYHIIPTGSADGVSKVFLFNKAVQRMQMFKGDPFIKQGELVKSVLEADDSSLVKRLYTSPQNEAATEAEDQATEIAILRIGFPAAVEASDDDVVHIQTCLQYLHQRGQLGVPVDPVEQQRVIEHINEHIQQLSKKDPKMARQIVKQLQQAAEPQPMTQ